MIRVILFVWDEKFLLITEPSKMIHNKIIGDTASKKEMLKSHNALIMKVANENMYLGEWAQQWIYNV